MLQHTGTGTFATVGPHTVTLKVTNLPPSGSYDIAVFGIEMVRDCRANADSRVF